MARIMTLNAKWNPAGAGFRALLMAVVLSLPASASLAADFFTIPMPQLRDALTLSQGIDEAAAEVAAAENALADARRRLAEGEEPLPGERSGIGGGRSRLNEAYAQRQATLKRAVEAAEKRLQQA